MTVELEYSSPTTLGGGEWQVAMAEKIAENRGPPITDIRRVVDGRTLTVIVETDLPAEAVEGMMQDIEESLPAGATHVETREE